MTTAHRREEVMADLLAIPAQSDRLALLRREGLDGPDGLTGVLDRVEELVHDDPSSAESLAELCGLAAQEAPSIGARARYLRARVLADQGALERGLVLIDEAGTLWWQSGQQLQSLRTALGRMAILDDLGRHAEAAAVGQESLAALDGVNPTADEHDLHLWLRAALLENVGVAHGFLGDHQRALEAYGEAASTYSALGLEEDTARPLANRGIELLELGRGREALAVLLDAADRFQQHGDRLWAAKCRGHIAQAHRQLGELLAALDAIAAARPTLDELGAETESVRLQVATAELSLTIGLIDEAAEAATEAADRATAAGMIHDAALARFTLALTHLFSGRLAEAAHDITVAAELFEGVGDRHRRALLSLAQAELLLQQGQVAEAVTLGEQAVVQLAEGSWSVELAHAELWLARTVPGPGAGDVHLARGQELADTLRLPQLRLPLLHATALGLRRAGRVGEAVEVLRTAVDEVEHRGWGLADQELSRAFLTRRLAAHDELLDVLVERAGPGDLEEALRVSDRAKARTLLDLVNRTLGPHEPAVDTNGPRDAVPTPSTRNGDGDRQESPLTAPSTTTLSYHVLGDEIVAFVVHEGRTTVRRLGPLMPAVRTELERLSAQWSRFRIGADFALRVGPALMATARAGLRELSDLLVSPVADLLPPSGSLLVVPHRRLTEVPFHALDDGTGPLVARWTISVAPTSTGTTETVDVSRGHALVLGVPDEHAPHVASEVAAVDHHLGAASVHLGDEATADVLLTGAGEADVLHLACHGLYHAGNPLFSSLRLADRWVTAAEILQLDLRGALVVLSACESGRQGGSTAEPVGLAWAFLAAGASGLVVSQWVVHDDVTAQLMSALYEHLVSGLPAPQALRLAQLATARQHPHPFHWAPFTYVAAPSGSYDLRR